MSWGGEVGPDCYHSIGDLANAIALIHNLTKRAQQLGMALVPASVWVSQKVDETYRVSIEQAEQKAAAEKYGPIFAKFRSMDLNAVAGDKEANSMGQRLFLTYCAQCHGADAKGAKGFPNLTDNDWLYGGEPETIKTTVLGGRQGMMPPFGPALGADGVKDVANYVRSLSGLAHDSLRAQRGKELFAQNCVACHGPEAKGTPALGAPNLTDKTWLYGSAEATIIETVTNGRTNKMPAFQEFLGEDKVHLLAAYVLSLSKNAAAPVEAKK